MAVHTQFFIIVIQKAACFGYTRQPASGFMFQKYKKEFISIHTAVKTYGKDLAFT